MKSHINHHLHSSILVSRSKIYTKTHKLNTTQITYVEQSKHSPPHDRNVPIVCITLKCVIDHLNDYESWRRMEQPHEIINLVGFPNSPTVCLLLIRGFSQFQQWRRVQGVEPVRRGGGGVGRRRRRRRGWRRERRGQCNRHGRRPGGQR